jgi:23S rRNA (guanosine2251-2'-O)-methyltransferase
LKIKKTGQTGRSGLDREWIYGVNPVLEALRAGRDMKSIYLSSGRHAKFNEINEEADKRKIPVKMMESAFFDRMFRKGHQGVAAEVSLKGYIPLEELLAIPSQKGELPFFLVIDCIEDPRNFGAIIRVADAAGVHGIIIQAHRSVTLDAGVSKVSAGAVEYVPVAMVTNIKHALRALKEREITIVGAEAESVRACWEANLKVPLALVIGSEGKGIRRTVRDMCDELIEIPMQGKINSLNASVATGILTFEILRQRMQKR